jgi:hypothetical protein
MPATKRHYIRQAHFSIIKEISRQSNIAPVVERSRDQRSRDHNTVAPGGFRRSNSADKLSANGAHVQNSGFVGMDVIGVAVTTIS